jgi:hypothetical protein
MNTLIHLEFIIIIILILEGRGFVDEIKMQKIGKLEIIKL